MRKIAKLAAILAAFGMALCAGLASCDSAAAALNVCSVNYQTERGTAPGTKIVLAGTVLSEADLPALSADGYTFGGWFDGETQAVAGSYKVLSHVTLTAKWTATPAPSPAPAGSVTVTFDPNGGTITTTTQNVPANTATALTTAAALGLKRDGYTFAGWGTASGATTAAYADGASVTLNSALTLYAIWNAVAPGSHTITVTSGTATPTSAAAGATVTIKANDPEAGKAFDKWTTATPGVTFASETSAETTFTMPDSDVAVTATYKDAAKTLDLSTVTQDTIIEDNTIVTGTLAGNYKISIADGATVTLKDVTINGTNSDSYRWAGLTCAGDATITLEGTNTVKGFWKYHPGVFVPKGKTLTIKGSGSLTADSNGRGAGIGGTSSVPKEEGSCGTIVIEGGTITATGDCAAGIGCGGGSDCDGVTIKGGTVTATGGEYAAGIGSADNGSCGPISITGGAVTAKGGQYGAGIGSGDRGSCGPISISGGTVTATGARYAAGIGSGSSVSESSCGPISITGGTVTAAGGDSAAGVGTGGTVKSKCGAITVANTVTKFKATKGSGATDSVGRGPGSGACGAVTIGDKEYWDGAAYQNDGATVLGESPCEYPAATKYNVTVTNGTANPTSAKEGATVTITANAPAEGKAFDKWTTTSGVTFTDANASSTTFVMPASAVTVEATYKDAPKIVDLSTVTADTTVADGFTITGTLANNVKISIAAGATVTLKNASINADGTWTSGDYAGLNCLGDATITLEAGTTNTVKGFKITYPGIHVPSGKTLTINGTGALTVSPNTSGAGMSATGAGIGGGVDLPCGNIVIAGGTITASTASHAAAIGSGGNYTGTQTCGNITITGGTVTATCLGSYGAGIGAGINGECGNISITGGTVTATGASAGAGGAGIGCGGTKSTVGTITIADTVAKVTAVKGYNAKSIGKGFDSGTCVCGTITIGGTPYADGIATSPYTYPNIPTGGINGLFSVSATKKVYFSKGNLRATYDGSSWTWSFADHQYDAVGNAAANTSINGPGTVSANGSVDLFGWVGDSSDFIDNMALFGISNSTTNSNYAGGALKNDWGTNAISNGGNVANYGWRTLTQVEWNYVVSTRAGADSKKGAATVNNVAGWILLPDAWTLPAGASFTAGCASGYATNSYSAEQWAVMESAGAVFLPVTGRRTELGVQWLDEGYYWSATVSSEQTAYNAKFTESSFFDDSAGTRYKGTAVRLAKDSN